MVGRKRSENPWFGRRSKYISAMFGGVEAILTGIAEASLGKTLRIFSYGSESQASLSVRLARLLIISTQ